MNRLNNVRLRQCQQLIVTFDENFFSRHGKVCETLAAIIFLAELVALNHGAHCTIKNQNTARHQLSQLRLNRGNSVAFHRVW